MKNMKKKKKKKKKKKMKKKCIVEEEDGEEDEKKKKKKEEEEEERGRRRRRRRKGKKEDGGGEEEVKETGNEGEMEEEQEDVKTKLEMFHRMKKRRIPTNIMVKHKTEKKKTRMRGEGETTTYSCHVHGTFASVAKSLTVYVRRPSLGPLTCPPDRTPDNIASQTPPILWPETLSDVTAIRDLSFGSDTQQRPGCLVTRRCVTVGTRVEWRLPNFDKCPTTGMASIRNNLTKLSLGFVQSTVSQMLTELRKENVASAAPGSREVTVDIISQLLNYVNASYTSGKVNDLLSQHETQASLQVPKDLNQRGILLNQQVFS
ncbi:hypothetical protein WDU94_002735 [Cyamophila willieti]